VAMSVLYFHNEIVHYEVLGRGKPLLFLHGWVGSWRYWMPAMQSASVSYRTYALDLWGFGDTAKSLPNYALEKQLDLIDSFLQEMGIGKVALVGHGLGAVLAASFASRNPGLVDRILAVSLPDGSREIDMRMYKAPPAELADWLLSHTAESELARQEAPKADGRAIQLSLAELDRRRLTSLVRELAPPSLFVYGMLDPAVPVPENLEENARPEQIHTILFEQSGHFPMLDEPNKSNRLLADFLALPSGVSPRQLQLKDEWRRRVR
jgi:pimeloyl-ACP methyl ester carboxylesterase